MPASRAARQALDAGLAYLARRQGETQDGSFSVSEVKSEQYAPIGVSSLATLAFLAAGSTPERGPYGGEVSRAIDYLLRHVDLPAQIEFGAGLVIGGAALVLGSLVWERIQDAREEGDLLE